MIKAPKFWYKESLSFLSIILLPLNIIWIFGSLLKKLISKRKKVNIPVISIGSAIIGGSGKTPTVLFICDLLKKIGLKPHIVSRGYGGKYISTTMVREESTYQEVGDEALMMSAYNPTWVSRNRYLGCKMAEENGANIIVLDDGLQTTSIVKDFSIYVFDGMQRFGNNFLVPAGPLRETIKEAVSKCSIIFQINDNGIQDVFLNKFKTYARYKLEENHPLLEKKILAFAGLGFNRKFFDQLSDYGFNLVKIIDFPDHHKYSIQDIYSLLDQANSLDAHLMTTEKDHIRIPIDFKESVNFIKGQIEIDNEDALIREFKKNID
jgi:tetraacyldisaccharide 4'-kinase|tara:strand:+ start:267 stop:1229 length:963 start_codon:yes stop_codon:yes gene_type:complete